MSQRARRAAPEVRLDVLHRFLLIGSVLVSIGVTAWFVARIPSMPDEIPMHFAADGSVNRYGSPWEMLILVAVMLPVIVGCAILTRYPQIYNYNLGRVTEDNIQAHYTNGVQMMTWIVFSCTALYIIILGAMAGDWPLTPAIWISLALMMAPITFFSVRMARL